MPTGHYWPQITEYDIKSLSVDWKHLKDGAITTAKIGDNQVTPAKLSHGTNNHVMRMSGSNPDWGLLVNANVASNAAIEGSKLQEASTSNAGVVNTGSQSFLGVKDFFWSSDANIIRWGISGGSSNERGSLYAKEASSGRDRSGLWLSNASTTTVYFFGNDGVFRQGGTGNISATGGADGGTVVGTQTSDERLKTDIRDYAGGLQEVLRLRPIKYILHGKEEIGFGAQTTKKIIPESVYDTLEPIFTREADPGPPNSETPNFPTRLAMDYVRLIPALVNAIKELNAMIEDRI